MESRWHTSTIYCLCRGMVLHASCKVFMEALGNVKTVTCTQSSLDGTTKGCVYNIAFTEWPVLPMQNNIFDHEGNPPLSSFGCSTAAATASSGTITCALADVNTADVPEYLPCSRRGTCAISTGVCTCATGFSGKACDVIGAGSATTCDSPDLLLHGTCSSIASTAVLKVKTTKTKVGYLVFFLNLFRARCVPPHAHTHTRTHAHSI